MPWIKPEHKTEHDTLSLKLDIVVMRQLGHYARFLQSTRSYIVTEILRDVFARDKDFQAWLRTNETSSREAQHELHGESQHDQSASEPATPTRRGRTERPRPSDGEADHAPSDEAMRDAQESRS